MKPPAWTQRKIQILRAGYAAATPVAEIGRQIGCTRMAVTLKGRKLGLTHPNAKRMPKEGKQKAVQGYQDKTRANVSIGLDTAISGPENGFTRHVEKPTKAQKPLSLLARQDADANAIRAKRGEGDHEEIERTDWTVEQQAILADGINRGASVEEIARSAAKSIPETYAKIQERRLRGRRLCGGVENET